MGKHGQRLTTVLVSLNEDYEGGETFFPGLDLKVGPKTGRAIVFHSLEKDGKIDHDSLHAGLPIFSLALEIRTLRANIGGVRQGLPDRRMPS